MQLINLTPHAISLYDRNGERHEVAPSGQIARVAQTREDRPAFQLDDPISPDGDGISRFDTNYSTFGQVEGLPEPEKGVAYLVSALVMSAVPDRTDVFAPGELLRDAEGRVIGARGLSCTPAYRG